MSVIHTKIYPSSSCKLLWYSDNHPYDHPKAPSHDASYNCIAESPLASIKVRIFSRRWFPAAGCRNLMPVEKWYPDFIIWNISGLWASCLLIQIVIRKYKGILQRKKIGQTFVWIRAFSGERETTTCWAFRCFNKCWWRNKTVDHDLVVVGFMEKVEPKTIRLLLWWLLMLSNSTSRMNIVCGRPIRPHCCEIFQGKWCDRERELAELGECWSKQYIQQIIHGEETLPDDDE